MLPQSTADLQKRSLGFRDSSNTVDGYRSGARSDTSSDDEAPPAPRVPSSQYKTAPAPAFSMKALTAPQTTFKAGPFTTGLFTSIPPPQPTTHPTTHPALQLPAIPSAEMPSRTKPTEHAQRSKTGEGADQSELSMHLSMLSSVGGGQEEKNELAGSPIFTTPVLRHAESSFSQFGFLAGNADILDEIATSGIDTASLPANLDPRIYFNISAPSSAFICGSQGSGKSHTLSCLLENCLLKSPVSKLDNPLSGLVFHYDSFISDVRGTPCEAAHLSSNPKIKVRILCSPSNVQTIKRTYSGLSVQIDPLMINQHDLNTKRMLDLMAVNTEDGKMPLYLHEITRILRAMRVSQQESNGSFNYAEFKRKVEDSPMTAAQQAPLTQRLDTLESFMPKSQTEVANKKTKKSGQLGGNDWTVKAGMLTIVDLSCPCVTSEAACALFNMCLSLFLEQKTNVGRVVALDEAHKYMNAGSEASTLTNTLLSSIRLQRHLGTRVFISTQEPSISPKLLDLCSITIVHRFTSPDWLRCLRAHLAALDNDDGLTTHPKLKLNNVFNQIVKLKVGQALLFSPSAIVNVKKTNDESGVETHKIERLGIGYLRVKIRDRVTADGGRSVLALGSDAPFATKGSGTTAGASIFGGAASSSSGFAFTGFTSTAPPSSSTFGMPANGTSFGGKSTAGLASAKTSNGLSIFNSTTAPFTTFGGAATANSSAISNTTTTSSIFSTSQVEKSANINTPSLSSSTSIFASQATSAAPIFATNSFGFGNENKNLFGSNDQIAVKTEQKSLPLFEPSATLSIGASSLRTPAAVQGVFPKPVTVFPITPSTLNFSTHVEKEIITSDQYSVFQTINFKAPWSPFSFEELRLGDYGRGNKMV